MEVRLTGGNKNWGRVEVRHGSVWNKVCNKTWEDSNTIAICKSLGMQTGYTMVSTFGPGPGRFWHGDIKCTGSENSLSDCTHVQESKQDCSPDHETWIVCGKFIQENIPYASRSFLTDLYIKKLLG